MDWLDLLAVQGALKSLLKHHSSKASVLQCSAFFMTAQMEAKKKTNGGKCSKISLGYVIKEDRGRLEGRE